MIHAFWFIKVSEHFDQYTAEKINEEVWTRVSEMAAKELPSDVLPMSIKQIISAFLSYAWVFPVFIILGLWIVWPTLGTIRLAKEARNWEKAQAKITHSELKESDGRLTIKGILDNGRRFETSRISIGEMMTREQTLRYADEFTPGRFVDVYISPRNPSTIILVNHNRLDDMYKLISVGFSLIVIAILSLLYRMKNRFRR